jgi:hypothetical protein
LATGVSKITGGSQPSVLDTLAASLAASGRFEEAVKIAEQAVQLANQQKQTELAAKIQSRSQLYRQEKPFLEGPDM